MVRRFGVELRKSRTVDKPLERSNRSTSTSAQAFDETVSGPPFARGQMRNPVSYRLTAYWMVRRPFL